MNKILEKKAGQYVVLGALAVGVFIVLSEYLKSQAKQAAAALSDVNSGTPYQGGGVVGTLGNVTNQASGGALQSVGEWIGGKLADWFQDDPLANQPDELVNSGTTLHQQRADNFYDRGLLN